MQEYERLLEESPSFRGNQQRAESLTATVLRTGAAARVLDRVVTIPTVVHVVHRTARENISDAQVASQLDVLDADFSASNADVTKVPRPWVGLVGDARIRFELADRDPAGKPSNGITRTRTQRTSFGAGDAVKRAKQGGAPAWPADRYLNIWVCTLGGGLLGYAQFPGGPRATDGVVVLNTAFGTTGTAAAPFNRGRTTTHEVGHWLNLRHIWGDTLDCSGGDRVPDTPNAMGPNTGKPTFPSISCNNGPHGDMFMNYMDYVDDAAMFMFTAGQVARMNACLAGPRKRLLAARS
jgi:hypothetical protein